MNLIPTEMEQTMITFVESVVGSLTKWQKDLLISVLRNRTMMVMPGRTTRKTQTLKMLSLLENLKRRPELRIMAKSPQQLEKSSNLELMSRRLILTGQDIHSHRTLTQTLYDTDSAESPKSEKMSLERLWTVDLTRDLEIFLEESKSTSRRWSTSSNLERLMDSEIDKA